MEPVFEIVQIASRAYLAEPKPLSCFNKKAALTEPPWELHVNAVRQISQSLRVIVLDSFEEFIGKEIAPRLQYNITASEAGKNASRLHRDCNGTASRPYADCMETTLRLPGTGRGGTEIAAPRLHKSIETASEIPRDRIQIFFPRRCNLFPTINLEVEIANSIDFLRSYDQFPSLFQALLNRFEYLPFRRFAKQKTTVCKSSPSCHCHVWHS